MTSDGLGPGFRVVGNVQPFEICLPYVSRDSDSLSFDTPVATKPRTFVDVAVHGYVFL